VADSGQYLRLNFHGADFLLPSAASLAIEQRDALTVDNSNGPVLAWRTSRQGRWPAYGLDRQMKPARRPEWQRAVFVHADPSGGVGILVDEVQLLTRGGMHIAPFTPLGAAPTRVGHLFNAAWVDGHKVVLVLDPKKLALYLHSIGGAA
jgi:hypothetical protein